MRRRHRAFASGILAVLVAGAASLSGQEQPVVPTFRSGVDLVALTATVQRPDGSFVGDLQAGDFRVFENGVPQTLAFFGSENVSVDLLLLIDNSASMYSQLPAVQHAAQILVDALGPNDRVTALSFGGAVHQRNAPTTDKEQAKAAIRQLRAGGGTPLYDALYIALRNLSANRQEMRRRAIVVLTDGDDTTSLMSFDAVIEAAHQSSVAVYIVSMQVVPTLDRAKTTRRMQSEYEMRTLAADTGARFLQNADAENLDNAYRAIARELTHQYTLGYVPDEHARTPARKFRPISILVSGQNLVVRARRGYLARY